MRKWLNLVGMPVNLYVNIRELLFLMGISIASLTFSCTEGRFLRVIAGDSSNSTDLIKVSDYLETFNYDYARMITLEDIEKHFNIDLGIVEKKDGGIRGEYGFTTYLWPSDRPDIEIKTAAETIYIPDLNSLGIKELSFYDNSSAETIDLFSMAYREFSQAELEKMNADLEKSYTDLVQLEKVRSLLKNREGRHYDLVENIGTRAYWKWGESFGGELVALVGRAKFTITTKVSNDPDQNLELARKLAQEVINKCN